MCILQSIAVSCIRLLGSTTSIISSNTIQLTEQPPITSPSLAFLKLLDKPPSENNLTSYVNFQLGECALAQTISEWSTWKL